MGEKQRSEPVLQVTKEDVVEALRASGGFLAPAAKMLGLSYKNLYQRVRNNVELQEVIEEFRESFLDIAETQLVKKMAAGDLNAIKYYLEHQGKSRGYTNKAQIEVSGPGGEPLKQQVMQVAVKDLSDALIARGVPLPAIDFCDSKAKEEFEGDGGNADK